MSTPGRESAPPASSKKSTAWSLEPIPVPQPRFAHSHIDLVGPLTPSIGFNHILTVICR
jgi:hypothetical protein